MKSDDSIYYQLVSFIKAEILGEDETTLHLERTMTLETDLGVTGIDAEKFILAFARRFNVDIRNFNIDDYFEPEVSFFRFRKRVKAGLTIGMLEEAIIMGVLK
jgi:acyl carrier protein